MTRLQWFHPLAVLLLIAAPGLEARAQKSMGKTVPPPTTELTEDKEAPPPPESSPLPLWRTLSGDGKPATLKFVRAGASSPSPMIVVQRGGLAITEGDMVVGPYDKVVSDFSRENAVRNPTLKWPKVNGKVTVPYRIDPSLSTAARTALQAAIQEFTQKTCVAFVPQTNQANYVKLFAGDGCYSYVGRIQQGAQEASLGRGCEYKGTAVHELMHAMGFYHEQSRPDRDQYITINFQNVEQGLEDQFDVCQDCTTQDVPYEYDSIMHYGAEAFTKNGQPTMVPKQRGARIVEPYDKPGLTALDVKKIHKLYACP